MTALSHDDEIGDLRVAATLRVMAGEPVERVANDLGVTTSEVASWREAFVEAGRAAIGEARLRPADERRERSARTREHLLTTAVECLAELGYANTSTNVVAKRAGISRGGQLHHFPNKIDLLVSAVELMLSRQLEEIEGRHVAVADRKHAALGAIQQVWTLFDGPTFSAALELITAARTDPALAERLVPLAGSFADQMVHLFHTLLDGHVANPEIVDFVATYTIHLMHGMALVRVLYPDPEWSNQMLVGWTWIAETVLGRASTGRRTSESDRAR